MESSLLQVSSQVICVATFRYDFNKPEELNEKLRGSFDMVVIDPPFITREVWEKYAVASKMLLKPEGATCAAPDPASLP